MSEAAVDAWVDDMVMRTTPEEWAEDAMSRATIKKTRRKFLRPHLAAVIREAQEAAVKRALISVNAV